MSHAQSKAILGQFAVRREQNFGGCSGYRIEITASPTKAALLDPSREIAETLAELRVALGMRDDGAMPAPSSCAKMSSPRTGRR